MLGLLVSIVKLLDPADVVPGIGLYAFAGLLLATAAANASMDHGAIWPRVGPLPAGKGPAPAATMMRSAVQLQLPAVTVTHCAPTDQLPTSVPTWISAP